MSSLATPELNPLTGAGRGQRTRLQKVDIRANRALRWLALGGGILVFLTLIAIVYQVINGASSAINAYGLGFLAHKYWIPSANLFGAWSFIYGTLVTGVTSVIAATLLGVAIGIFLALMAPRAVAAVVGPLVEMLAAIPSVVIGLIGIYLLAPFVKDDIEPWLHSAFGWIPLFGQPQPVGNSIFTASLVLTIMVVPIIAALTRDLFLTVPQDLRDGAEALGATRWEMIRGVVLPTTKTGITAAAILGFGRAIGEAIAVSQVVGGTPTVFANLFKGGYTSAGMLANQFISPVSAMHTSAMFYIGLILLVLGVLTNLTAQWISRSFGAKML